MNKLAISPEARKDIEAKENILLSNLDKIHTTELGEIRIKKNLSLNTADVIKWCIKKIKKADKIVRNGKNWYVYFDNSYLTINAHIYTIITAHMAK